MKTVHLHYLFLGVNYDTKKEFISTYLLCHYRGQKIGGHHELVHVHTTAASLAIESLVEVHLGEKFSFFSAYS